MGGIHALDWTLTFGVILLGLFLAVHFKKQYNIKRREFFAASFFVAALSVIVTSGYHVLRGLLLLSP
jgi:uncharacterized membrane protein